MVHHTLTTCRFYTDSLLALLIAPRRFFTELIDRSTACQAIGFLAICSLFSSWATLWTGVLDPPVKMGLILFSNAMGMTILSLMLSWMTMVMLMGKCVPFKKLFSVYAYASGITLLASWVPGFLWFTQGWKWWLVYTGFKSTCGFTGRQALLILILSLSMQFLFLYSLYIAFFR